MKVLKAVTGWLWWLCLAYVPLGLLGMLQSYRVQIGCPAKGDCYASGLDLLVDWNILISACAIFFWPPCFYYLLLVPARALWRWVGRHKDG